MDESWEKSFIICLPSSTFLALEGKSNIINNHSLLFFFFFNMLHLSGNISPKYAEKQEGSIEHLQDLKLFLTAVSY